MIPARRPRWPRRRITGGPGLPGLVLVDSFEFLNPRQQSLVAALADRTRVLVAIDREASERARWTASRLETLAGAAVVEELASRDGSAAASAHRAFDPEAQLRGIARAIKQRLGEEDALRPSDVAVAFRQASQHLALARRVFAEYELPFDPAAGERLASRPFGTWVLALLRLPAHDWRLTRLAELLRSAFLDRRRWGIEGDTVDHLLRVGRRKQLMSGLEQLLKLPPALEGEAAQAEGNDSEPYAARLRAAGSSLERAVAGPRRPARRRGPSGGRVGGGARPPPCSDPARSSAPPSRATRASRSRRRRCAADLDALRAIDEQLGGTSLTLEAFAAELERRMQRPAVLLREAGGVLFAPMHTLHGLRFAHVFVGGLVEGEFPAPPPGRPPARSRGARAPGRGGPGAVAGAALDGG